MEWPNSTWNPWSPYGLSTWIPHGIFHKHSMDSKWIPGGFPLIPLGTMEWEWIPGGFLTIKHGITY